ncbi:RRXRR domain-containing protein, partial [Desulfobacter latus]|uniref:RRXRR domain-containing protein n=1 Tax=Desulfobacter latus TaxID=2292 RepID=UPI0031B599B9
MLGSYSITWAYRFGGFVLCSNFDRAFLYFFTIRLLYGSSGYKQKVKLGIDAGYKTIGFSAVSQKDELVSGE